MKKTANTKNISKRVISLVAAAVMSVSMLTVGSLTASASEYQNNNYAVVQNTDGKAVRNMTVYVSPEWQQADATFLMYIYNSVNNLFNVVSVDSIEGTLTGLESNTKYYVCAYAKCEYGTSYSEVKVFTTKQ